MTGASTAPARVISRFISRASRTMRPPYLAAAHAIFIGRRIRQPHASGGEISGVYCPDSAAVARRRALPGRRSLPFLTREFALAVSPLRSSSCLRDDARAVARGAGNVLVPRPRRRPFSEGGSGNGERRADAARRQPRRNVVVGRRTDGRGDQ